MVVSTTREPKPRRFGGPEMAGPPRSSQRRCRRTPGGSSGGSGAAVALGYAGGAVLASLADTLMPEAFEEAKRDPRVAYFTALGFLLAYLISEG